MNDEPQKLTVERRNMTQTPREMEKTIMNDID